MTGEGGPSPRESPPRPADECPYERPFAQDFRDCPTFHPVQFLPLTSFNHPLTPQLTCRHLTAGLIAEGDIRRHYGCCEIGDVRAREGRVDGLDPARLEQIRALSRELGEVIAPHLAPLWEAKRAQTATAAAWDEGRPGVIARLELINLAAAEFLESNRDRAESAGLPVETCREVIRLASDRFAMERLPSATFRMPAEVLKMFGPEVRALLGRD